MEKRQDDSRLDSNEVAEEQKIRADSAWRDKAPASAGADRGAGLRPSPQATTSDMCKSVTPVSWMAKSAALSASTLP